MKATINSIKHYIQTPATGIASGAKLGIDLAASVAMGTVRTATTDVSEGCLIKAIFVEYWVKSDNPNFTVTGFICKLPSGVTAPTFAESQALQAWDNKKNILESHQGLSPSGDQVLNLFRHWVKIPKGKQRMGLGDRIQLSISLAGSAGDVCGLATFKEYL